MADASAAVSGVALGTERRASISAAVCCQCSAATWLRCCPLPGGVALAPASAPRRATGAASLRVSYNSTTPAACGQRTVLHVGFARQHLLNVTPKVPAARCAREADVIVTSTDTDTYNPNICKLQLIATYNRSLRLPYGLRTNMQACWQVHDQEAAIRIHAQSGQPQVDKN